MIRTPVRLWIAAGVAAASLLTLAAWLFVVSPQRSTAAAHWVDLRNAEQQSNMLRAGNSALESQLAQIADQRAGLEVKRESLPQTNSLDDLVHAASAAATTTGVSVIEVTAKAPVEIGALLTPVEPVVAAPAEGESPEEAAASAAAAAAEAVAAEASRVKFYVLPVTLRATGPLAGMKEFIRLVQSGQPRAILFTSVTMVPAEGAASLEESATMTAETQVFVSPQAVQPVVPAA